MKMADGDDPVAATLAPADCFHVAQFLILCECMACGSKLQRYEIYDGKGLPFLRAIDVTDCMTRCCIGECHMELACTDPDEESEFVMMTFSGCPCDSRIEVHFFANILYIFFKFPTFSASFRLNTPLEMILVEWW